METYLATVSWTEQHVEQVRVAAASASEAAAEARVVLRGKYGDRMVQTTGGEHFRATEVQQITQRPSTPKKMPKERRGPKGKGTDKGRAGQGRARARARALSRALGPQQARCVPSRRVDSGWGTIHASYFCRGFLIQ